MAEQLHEPLDACVPEALVAPEPFVGPRERPWIDAAIVDPAADGPFDQARTLEILDVLRRRGEGHPVRRRELADGPLALSEPLEHRATGVVAEGSEDQVEAIRTLNHGVEYVAQ